MLTINRIRLCEKSNLNRAAIEERIGHFLIIPRTAKTKTVVALYHVLIMEYPDNLLRDVVKEKHVFRAIIRAVKQAKTIEEQEEIIEQFYRVKREN